VCKRLNVTEGVRFEVLYWFISASAIEVKIYASALEMSLNEFLLIVIEVRN
jgi:hypothetical protein